MVAEMEEESARRNETVVGGRERTDDVDSNSFTRRVSPRRQVQSLAHRRAHSRLYSTGEWRSVCDEAVTTERVPPGKVGRRFQNDRERVERVRRATKVIIRRKAVVK